MDKSPRQKISKETSAFHDTLNQMDLIDTYRTFHPELEKRQYFSSACGTLSRSLNAFKKIETISRIFSDHNSMKPAINYRIETGKKHTYVDTKQHVTEQPKHQ